MAGLKIGEQERKQLGEKLAHNIYFNKRARAGIKKDFSDLREMGLKVLEYPTVATLEAGKDRILAETMIDLGNMFLAEVKNAETRDAMHNQYGKFVLYRKGKEIVYYMETLRAGKIRRGYLLFTKGLGPKKQKVIRFLGKYSKKGAEEIDSGKYHMKQSDFKIAYFRFWGKKFKTLYNVKILGGTKEKLNMVCERRRF